MTPRVLVMGDEVRTEENFFRRTITINSFTGRSLIYPISTVDLYFQAASAQDLEFALSVFSVKVVRHAESLHFGVTLWKSAGG